MEHKELYELLGVDRNSTDADIKKNYRKLAKEFHPDKNPQSGDKFKEISFAYEVLSNPDKRKIYDRYGLKGLREGEGFSDASDLFAQWFPFRSQASTHSHVGQPAPLTVKLHVPLEDFYNGGVSKTVTYKRTECCASCHGKGGPEEAVVKCLACGGLGRTANSLMGFSQFEIICQSCAGRGSTIKEELRCAVCTGRGLVEQECTREVTVERGAPNLLKIALPGEGNQAWTGDRGDLIVTLVQIDNAVFVRSQNDLFLRDIQINLTQSLCGFVHCFKHLDGRNITIQNTLGDILRHGEVKVVPGEGMPLRNNPFEKGDLFVEFHIEFPDNNFATAEQLKVLESLLPPRVPVEIPPDAEEVELTDPLPYGQGYGGPTPGNGPLGGEEDLAAGMQFEGVQCQTA